LLLDEAIFDRKQDRSDSDIAHANEMLLVWALTMFGCGHAAAWAVARKSRKRQIIPKDGGFGRQTLNRKWNTSPSIT
jgi:hypothetical protein